MRKTILMSAILAATTTITPAALAQTSTSPTGPAFSTRFFTTPLENDPSREVRLQMQLHLPNRPGNPFHTHSGDQWEAVVEGEITFTVRGQEPRVLKAGESVYIPRGTIHREENSGTVPTGPTGMRSLSGSKLIDLNRYGLIVMLPVLAKPSV